ncbi:MAG: response regulator [Bacteroidetes bacterium]|nr:response regulator [Bacteroidota bacterium]
MNKELNVLYVDDEAENLIVFRSGFKREFNVFVAESAAEAWSILNEELIHVVVSDQRMPVCTGTQFFAELKEKKPSIIRILLTGYADFEDVITAINEGKIYHYINKPWDRSQLQNVINNGYKVYRLQEQNKSLIQRLEAHNVELERRVAERTLALEQSNLQLEEQNQKLEEVNIELSTLNQILTQKLDENNGNLGFDEKLNEELEQKSKELASFSLQLIQKNQVLIDLKVELKNIMKSTESSTSKKFRSLVNLIDYSFSVEKEWNRFRQVFENVHQDFYNKLESKHPNLTASDRKLAALFKLNLGSKEIADILGISQDSLKTARHRLRKKMELPGGEDLHNYFAAL